MDSSNLLKWYMEAGVDEAIGDAPVNRLRVKADAVPAKPAPVPSPLPTAALSPGAAAANRLQAAAPSQAMAEARRLGDAATTLEALEAAVRGFDGCTLKKTATKTVFCDGNPKARIMLVGEAPGASEDLQGIPFCGPSGQLLDAMLKAIGLDRTSVYITNTVYWRPPGNRPPTQEELAICRPLTERHVALIDPKLLVLVGGTATAAMLGTQTGISRLRGKIYEYRTLYLDRAVPTSVLFHPSYLLRQPAQKRLAWADLREIARIVK